MTNVVQTDSGTSLTLADAPFASGGEAELYRIERPTNRRGQVVKLYKPDKQTPDRARKIRFLTQHPPGGLPTDPAAHRAVVWPLEPVSVRGRFAGFVMPEVSGQNLELLCLPGLPPPLRPAWGRFDRAQPGSRALRLKLCFNLAVALYTVHESGRYVLVDMKPDNIIVRPDGLVSLIDLDSVQVLDNDQLLFAAPVATPEYSPPEPIVGRIGQASALGPAWDRFGAAVIFYRLLCGIHPFTGTAKPPLDRQTDTAGMIRHGLFPNGRRVADFAVIPAPHRLFGQLPPAVQRLFRQCFDDGHDDPEARPTADDWCRALSGQTPNPVPGSSAVGQRELPSARLVAPNLVPSPVVAWPGSLVVEVPGVTFADLNGAGGMWSIFRRLLGNVAGPALQRVATQAQSQVRQEVLALLGYEHQFARIVAAWQTRQAAVLNREQADFKAIESDWLRVLADLDREAMVDMKAEAVAGRAARKPIQPQIDRLMQQRQRVYARLVGKLETQLNQQQLNWQQRTEALTNARELARQRGLYHPQKLVGYRIEPNKLTIFGANLTVIVQKLARAGIQTAADFVAVRDGQFQRPDRVWTKVPGVGKQRTTELIIWRQAIENRHDMLLDSMLDTQFGPRQQQLQTDRQTDLARFETLLTQARAQFAQQTTDLTAQLTDLTRQADALASVAIEPYADRDADRMRRAEQAQQKTEDRAHQRRQQTNAERQRILDEETTRHETLRRSYLTDRARLLIAIDRMRQAEAAYLG